MCSVLTPFDACAGISVASAAPGSSGKPVQPDAKPLHARTCLCTLRLPEGELSAAAYVRFIAQLLFNAFCKVSLSEADAHI